MTLFVPSQEQIGKNVSIREKWAYISWLASLQRHKEQQIRRFPNEKNKDSSGGLHLDEFNSPHQPKRMGWG